MVVTDRNNQETLSLCSPHAGEEKKVSTRICIGYIRHRMRRSKHSIRAHSDMTTSGTTMQSKKPIYKSLYVQVLFAIACGVLIGHFHPETAVKLKPLGDGFIK